jgi:GH43 family beta-xylosidase
MPHARRSARDLRVERLEDRIALAGEGLTAQYFHNADFTGLALERVEAVNHSWGTGVPAPGIHADSFSVRWTGQIEARYSEIYTFRIAGDDGARLWIDGQLVIDNWTAPLRVSTGTIALAAGQRYDIRLEYFESNGAASIAISWSSASQALENVPASQLYESPPGVWGEYSDGFGGKGARVDAAIDFDWDAERPISTVAVDNFSVRWTGLLRPEHSEQYAFSTLSDEGVRVWIGDELIIDHWDPHRTASATGVKDLEAGKWYDLRVEYFDVSGNAEAHLSWSSPSQTGGELEVVPSESLRAGKHTPLFFTNPLGGGADPFVVRHDGQYLLVRSSGSSIRIDRAERLEDIHSSDPASTTITAWTAPPGMPYSSNIWAPELHQINGKWYIYVAADNGANENHRMYVLERDSPDPYGAYTFKGQITDSSNRWAIDGTVLQWQDKLYFVWSGWPETTNVQQNLYIAEMSNPWTISSNRVLISSPNATWERHGLPINEGPQILINDGQLHIIYSGSGFWTPDYALGRLTYKGTGELTNISSWMKATAPVFRRAGEIVGTGHASFTKSPDGTQDWIVYHAHGVPSDADPDPPRRILIQPFTYFANGTPNFGSPIPTTTKLEVPSGYADANRVLLAGDFDANGAVNALDLNVWKAQVGSELFPGRTICGGDFLMWQQQLGATATAASANTVGEDAIGETTAGNNLSVTATSASVTSDGGAAPSLVELSGLALASPSTMRGATERFARPGPTLREELADRAFTAWRPAPVCSPTNRELELPRAVKPLSPEASWLGGDEGDASQWLAPALSPVLE